MRVALITDIHGNREALTAVLADLAARGCDRIAVLGDIVGYGPDPGWCVDKVAELVAQGAMCLKGNHDEAIALGSGGMSRNAGIAIQWTKGQLTPVQAAFLAGLPMTAMLGEALLVHASAEVPGEWNYVTSDIRAMGAFRATRARLIFCGHVHVPALYAADLGGVVREQRIKFGLPLPLLPSRRWLAVVGSVGQPRDRNPAAGYAIWDEGMAELTFRRVPYDCGKTAGKVRAAGLPEALALRLLGGD
jgi:diadenosine tetraphosphatase ApaH/serine/threonine PP2A family protein phosphatase